MKQVGIYTILSPSGKVYVGQSINTRQRFVSYRNNNCSYQTRLHRSINKHGWETHTFKVMIKLATNVPQSTLDFWEQYLMDFYRAQGYELMNLREGGRRGGHHESTKKIFRKKVGPLSSNWGYKHNDISKKRMRDAKLGKKHSEELCLKQSKQFKEDYKTGKRKPTPHLKGKIRIMKFKPVICLDTGFCFDSQIEAAKAMFEDKSHKSHKGISKVCRGYRNTYKGFKFTYL